VQQAFSLHGPNQATVPGNVAWSADSTVMTYTPASLLVFSQDYGAGFSGQVKPANGNSADLSGTENTWTFGTTDPTHVNSHYPDSDNGLAQPSTNFGFGFNNSLADGQDVAQFLTISPAPR